MKKTFRVLAIISIALVIGFSFAACDDGNGPGGGGGSRANLTGTWQDDLFGWYQFVFTSYNWTYYFSGTKVSDGTYTVSGSTVRLTESSTSISLSNKVMTIKNSTTLEWGGTTLYKRR
jgi:hypothetical protein